LNDDEAVLLEAARSPRAHHLVGVDHHAERPGQRYGDRRAARLVGRTGGGRGDLVEPGGRIGWLGHEPEQGVGDGEDPGPEDGIRRLEERAPYEAGEGLLVL